MCFKHPSKKVKSVKIWLCFHHVSHKSHEWSCLEFTHWHGWLDRAVRTCREWATQICSSASPGAWGKTRDHAGSVYRHYRQCMSLVGQCFVSFYSFFFLFFQRTQFYYAPLYEHKYYIYLFISLIYILALIDLSYLQSFNINIYIEILLVFFSLLLLPFGLKQQKRHLFILHFSGHLRSQNKWK